MNGHLLAADVYAVSLQQAVLAGTEILEGSPSAGHTLLGELGNDVDVGVWEMSAGGARDVADDEIVLAEHGTLRFADGGILELHPGVLVRLRAGEHTEWRVSETLPEACFSR